MATSSKSKAMGRPFCGAFWFDPIMTEDQPACVPKSTSRRSITFSPSMVGACPVRATHARGRTPADPEGGSPVPSRVVTGAAAAEVA